MSVKENPVTVVFKHQGQELEGLVIANKGICWQVELDDGSTVLVQKKHVISESSEPRPIPATAAEDPAAEEDEPAPEGSLAAMLTQIRATGKADTARKTPRKAREPKPVSTEPSNMVGLKQLCAELEVEPRVARRRLRKSQGQIGTGQRWEWEAGSPELEAIRSVIIAA